MRITALLILTMLLAPSGVALAEEVPPPPELVTICHKPGTPAQQTLTVPAEAVPGHLAHGDTLGECEELPPPPPPPPPSPPNGHNNGASPRDIIRDNATLVAPLSIESDIDQDADSGDLTQSVDITGGGDNSNQCAGPQITGSTGNAQNIGDGESNIDASPDNSTSCTGTVNQAAAAS